MHPYLTLALLAAVALLSLVFSTLTYALRDLSRIRLHEALEKRGRESWLEPTMDHLPDLIFVTAVLRLFSNMALLLLAVILFDHAPYAPAARYALSALVAGVVSLLSSVAFPHALSRHAGESFIASCITFLHTLRTIFIPLTALMHIVDELVRRAAGKSEDIAPQQIEDEILSAVEEGQKEGVVDQQERTMIESVIQFRDTTCGQIMTSRSEIVAIDVASSLAEVKESIEQSGHSRLPVYEGTVDKIIGILYARDLLHLLGEAAERFNIRATMRSPFFVPVTKPLRDLLHDFRLQKIHIAIVLDEYGGTAGLVTIEDILEELVGDISDEHEPLESAMFKRLSEYSAEADARLYIDELNRLMSLSIPEDAGYDTLGGFVSTTLGRIPEAGTTFEFTGSKFTVLDAEPQKVNRVKVEVIAQPAEAATAI